MDTTPIEFNCERDRRLFQLQLCVAQRADELARLLGNSPGHGFELWRQAESEIWSHISSNENELKEFAASTALTNTEIHFASRKAL